MSSLPIPATIARIAPDGNLSARQKRRMMLEMVTRRIRPGAGSSIEFLKRRTAMNVWPDLRKVLHGIDWVLVGGVATRAYMPERTTKDMDVLVDYADRNEVMQQLKTAGYQVISKLAIPGYLFHSPEGVEVDVIFGRYPWIRAALHSPRYDPAGYPVIALGYLVLMKLTAQRVQDWADISRMLGWASDADLNTVREVITHHSPEDLEDLERLIFLGRQEQAQPPDLGE